MKTEMKAYSVAEGHPTWLAPCDFCGKVHLHGAGPGRRSAHCGSHPSKPSAGYELVYAGQASDELLAAVFGKGWRKLVHAQAAVHQRRVLRKRLAKAA